MAKRIASFGSVISGTHRNQDLIEAFVNELIALKGNSKNPSHTKLIKDARKVRDFDSERASNISHELMDALGEYAPQYGYFGAHPGDGADFGFWLSEIEDIRDQVDLVVEETSEVPKGFSGEVLAINDHGNVTLYAYSCGRSREVWSVV